jgi:secondary thiamine-phosphate synthase enzyme
MGMDSRVVRVHTGRAETTYNLTGECEAYLRDVAGGGDGLLHVWVPHATAGLAIIESGAGSDTDLLAALRDLLPPDDRWRHRHGSPGHGRDHVLPALVPPFAMIPVVGGRMALGTWQSVVLVDTNTDNHDRQVRLTFLAG